jgi:hypothetical protein
MFITQLFKEIKTSSIGKPIVVWDRAPYKKESYIPQYKGDRDKIDRKEVLFSDEEREEFEKYEIFKQSKNEILYNFEGIGIPQFFIQGYEADDLIYYITNYFKKYEPKTNILLMTIDSDWKFFVDLNIDLKLIHRGTYYTIKDFKNDFKYHNKLDRMTYFALHELKNSHNNAKLNIPLPRNYIEKYIKYKRLFNENNEHNQILNNYIKYINPETYYEPEIDHKIKSILDSGTISYRNFYYLCSRNNIKLTKKYFTEFTNSINKSLYERVEE